MTDRIELTESEEALREPAEVRAADEKPKKPFVRPVLRKHESLPR